MVLNVYPNAGICSYRIDAIITETFLFACGLLFLPVELLCYNRRKFHDAIQFNLFPGMYI